MPRRAKSKNAYTQQHENSFTPLPLPSGVPVPMCFCCDMCKVPKSDKDEALATYRMCVNFVFEPTAK